MKRSKVLYLIFLICSIELSIFYNQYISFAVLSFIILIPFFLYAITLITSKNITASFEKDNIMIERSQSCELNIKVANKSMFHIVSAKITIIIENTFSDEKTKEVIIIPIKPNETTIINTHLISSHCGNLKVTIKSIKFYDFFALTSHKKTLNNSINLWVMPNIFSIESKADILLLEDDESVNFSNEKSGNDVSQIFDYHNYREGDKMKNVHWKLSVKLDQLMVKELSLPLSSAICVMLELGAGHDKSANSNLIDAQIDVFASVSQWLISDNIPHQLKWYDEKNLCSSTMNICNMDDLYLSIQSVYNSKPHNKNLLLDEFEAETVKHNISHLVYITNSVDENVANTMYRIKQTLDITVLFISDSILNTEIKNSLEAAQINLIQIDVSAIKENLQNISL